MNVLYLRRRITNVVGLSLSLLATLFTLFWLFWILWTTFTEGIAALNWRVVTEMTPPPGSEGGLLNAIYGSFVMIVIAVLIGSPTGILAGIYLAEFGKKSALAGVIRFINDILLSAPSIIIGLFVYELVVRPQGHFSAWAGSIALAIIMLPVVIRVTDETLRLVPDNLREAALAVGAPKWSVVLQVTLPAAVSGVLTGVLLGIARISGETAPLLFTALNNQFWSTNLNGPMANIPVSIFQFALSPYEQWHSLAWAGGFIVTFLILMLSIVSRMILFRK
ncbi:MAG: phosphate ABC transporter permease PstA [Verrucomicrobia bacterium]|nr:phosphate ABC transporter permease PstA [Verrucomicrobiota bacterium]